VPLALASRGYSSSLASSANSGSRSRKLGEKRKKILEGEKNCEEQKLNSFLQDPVGYNSGTLNLDPDPAFQVNPAPKIEKNS
jgi:hypothetical protein